MSQIEKILQAMIDETSYDETPQSRIEAILLAIKNNTQYSDLPYSRIEEILLAIKNNTSYDKEPMSRIEEILLAILNGTSYDKAPQSRIEELFINILNKSRNLFEGMLENINIGSSGNVGASTYDLYYGKIQPETIYSFSADGIPNNYVYVIGYFSEIPTVGSHTYNNSRIIQTAKTFTTPNDAPQYVGIRFPKEATNCRLIKGAMTLEKNEHQLLNQINLGVIKNEDESFGTEEL